MDNQSIINIQKKQMGIHRIVYGLFVFSRILLQIESDGVIPKSSFMILFFLVLSEILEEFFVFKDFFGKILLIRTLRYIQCIFIGLSIVLLYNSLNLQVMLISLLILYLSELILTLDIANKSEVFFYYISLLIPIMIAVITNINRFFDILLLFVVMYAIARVLVLYVNQMEKRYWSQENEISKLEGKNESISNMQKILKNSNVQLNLQKIELQKANEQVKAANEEMVAQADVLHYIAGSFEIPKISIQIIDSIMRVKKLGFCAVYIKENVYMNKEPNFVIRTDIAQLQGKIRDNIEDVYKKMVDEFVKESTYYYDVKKEFPFLKNININSVYVKVLEHEDEEYGLFMIGDQRRNLFEKNMSFYDVIIAQYDIAINNAKIYREMQFMARKDGLTGINNRLYFRKLFYAELNRAIKNNGSMCVALLDIDKFKNVNDTYGHLAGDEVIKRVASVMEECITKYSGFICRYGGEEFVAALPNRKLEVAQPIIEELFENICSQKVFYNESEIGISISIGLTAYPETCSEPYDLLKRADRSMYYAKEHGRHQICIDNENL